MTYTSAVFVVVLLVALAFFGWALTRRVQYVMIGRPEPRFDRPLTRTLGFLWLVFGQKKLFKERVGVIHFFIFWGFIVIAFGTLQIIAEGINPGFEFPWAESYAFLFIKDLLSLIVLIGLIVLAYIRYVVRKTRLEPSAEAGVILGLIFFLILSEFFYSGVSYALDPTPASEGAFVATAIAGWFAGASTAQPGGCANGSLVDPRRATARLPGLHPHLQAHAPDHVPGERMAPQPQAAGRADLPGRFRERGRGGVRREPGGRLHQKQLLDLYACAECGRCQQHCPADAERQGALPQAAAYQAQAITWSRGARRCGGPGCESGRRGPPAGRQTASACGRSR